MISGEALPRVHAALLRAQRAVVGGDDVAVVILGDDTDGMLQTHEFSAVQANVDALRAFELRTGQAGAECGADRAVLVTNIAAAQEYLWVFSVILHSGYDIARRAYLNADEDVIFGELEILDGRVRLTEESPGFTLLNVLLDPSFN